MTSTIRGATSLRCQRCGGRMLSEREQYAADRRQFVCLNCGRSDTPPVVAQSGCITCGCALGSENKSGYCARHNGPHEPRPRTTWHDAANEYAPDARGQSESA